jgi:hypothetical protein
METVLSSSLLPSQCHCLEQCMESIEKARRLHERLVEDAELTASDKVKVAREIAGLLWTIETGRNLPKHVRHSFARLLADADHRAGLSNAEGLRSPSEVWDHYERLEVAAAQG